MCLFLKLLIPEHKVGIKDNPIIKTKYCAGLPQVTKAALTGHRSATKKSVEVVWVSSNPSGHEHGTAGGLAANPSGPMGCVVYRLGQHPGLFLLCPVGCGGCCWGGMLGCSTTLWHISVWAPQMYSHTPEFVVILRMSQRRHQKHAKTLNKRSRISAPRHYKIVSDPGVGTTKASGLKNKPQFEVHNLLYCCFLVTIEKFVNFVKWLPKFKVSQQNIARQHDNQYSNTTCKRRFCSLLFNSLQVSTVCASVGPCCIRWCIFLS